MLTEFCHFRLIFFKLVRLAEKLHYACVVFFLWQILLKRSFLQMNRNFMQAFTQRVRYCCPILTQIWVLRPIFVELSKLKFDIVCTVHRKQLYKQTNKMHFLYVFILQFLYNSTCFERHSFHHQEFMIYCICSCVQTMLEWFVQSL